VYDQAMSEAVFCKVEINGKMVFTSKIEVM
jgi:hypothetical protein